MSAGERPDVLTVEQARDLLVELVGDWRSRNRLTTTAGVKSALVSATAGAFDEGSWGYQSFREFLFDVENEGRIQLSALPSKHWLILLPGESQEMVVAGRERRERALAGVPGGLDDGRLVSPRLRPEVWAATVTWLEGHRRLWDRVALRPFVYPLDSDREPAFVSQPDRFVEIPAADLEVQRRWMREWADTLDEAARDRLLHALDSAAPGEFRRELEKLKRTGEWRSELHRRVSELVRSWAERNGIEMRHLVDSRAHRPKSDIGAAPAQRHIPSPADGARLSVPANTVAELLRARLHRVIDGMSLQELMALSIPAGHLLDD